MKSDPQSAPYDWVNTGFILGTHIITAVGVPLYLIYHGLTWSALLIMVALVACCGVGITGGYHRLFSHKAYSAAWPVRLFYLLFGAGAVQNSAKVWCSDHRLHHRHIDGDLDPYNIKKGFWWAHMGWVLRETPEDRVPANIQDLESDPLVEWQHRNYVAIALGVGLVLPVALGFAFGDPWGGLLIGAMLRVVLVHHSTFLINSLAHTWGSQPYSDKDTSRDNFVCALLTMGEGYHNFHHTYGADYRNGVRAWHYDPTKWLVWTLSKVGLTKNLVRTPEHVILKARLEMQAKRMLERHAKGEFDVDRLEAARKRVARIMDRWAKVKGQLAALARKGDEESGQTREALAQRVRLMKARVRLARKSWEMTLRELREAAISATKAKTKTA